MKNQIYISLAVLNQEIAADPGELVSLPWFRNVLVVDVEDDFVDLEPSHLPVVALSRALSTHIKLCGVLDGYDYSSLPVVDVDFSHRCKLEYEVEFRNCRYQISIIIKYDFRDAEKGELLVGLSEAEIVKYFSDRIIFDNPSSSLTAIKFGYIFTIVSFACTINGLEVLL